ncbi:hypothetical protein VitviT2T_007180 [Vitis vinifera]|uniref:Proteasome subunit alpha type-2 n=3 Tax=Vitis vinifera TaxID=29760 RepID=A0ABY9BYL3_VITVI|nr:hypothetical protein VitviT2T_007180 [Vitis vinifera]
MTSVYRSSSQGNRLPSTGRPVKLNLSVLEDIDDDVELCMNLSKEESVIVLTGKKQATLVDPSGSYFSWKASAMGKNVSNAKTFLEKRYTDDMELDDAVHTAILTLKEGFEGQISSKNIEIGIIGTDRKFRQVLFSFSH